MQKIKVLFRKLKAKITGNVPCTFETVSGHDFVRAGEIPDNLFLAEVDHECKHCRLKVYYSTWIGGFVKKGNQ